MESGSVINCFSSFDKDEAMSPLREYETPSELEHLLKLFHTDHSQCPEVLTVRPSIGFALNGKYKVSKLRFFSDETQKFLLIFEANSVARSMLYITPAVNCEYDRPVLRKCIQGQVLIIARPFIDTHGSILVSCDTPAKEELLAGFADVLPAYEVNAKRTNPVEIFYTTDAQMEAFAKRVPTLPEGFTIEEVNVERDGDTINDNWKNAASPEATKSRLAQLLCLCVRDQSKGETVAWYMSACFGQFSNLFTLPSYRGRGLATALEFAMAQRQIKTGNRPFKYVDDPQISASNQRNPLWTRWERDGERVTMWFIGLSRKEEQMNNNEN